MELIYDEKLGGYICHAGPTPWSVRSVEPRENHTMLLGFADGTTRELNFKPLLKRKIFSELADAERFMRAKAKHGTVDWGNDIDISPEFLYSNSAIVNEQDTT